MLKRKYLQNISSPKRKVKARLMRATVVLLLLMLITYFLFIRPAILSLLDYQGKIYVTNAVTKVIDNSIKKQDYDYDDFVKITQGENNMITSVKSKGQNINSFKNLIMLEITSMLSDAKPAVLKIPLGTLLGNELLLGKGPKISIRISPVGYANVELISKFDEAGINQTSHSIILRVKMDYTTILPIYSKLNTVESDYLVAQTIIVGKVPQYYSESGTGTDRPLPSIGIGNTE